MRTVIAGLRLGYALIVGVGLFLQLTGARRGINGARSPRTLHLVRQVFDGLLQQFVSLRQPVYRPRHLCRIRVREPVAHAAAQGTEGQDMAYPANHTVQQTAHTVHHDTLQHLEKVLGQVEDGIYQIAHGIQYAHHKVVYPAQADQLCQSIENAGHEILDRIRQVQYKFRYLRNNADDAPKTAAKQTFYAAADAAQRAADGAAQCRAYRLRHAVAHLGKQTVKRPLQPVYALGGILDIAEAVGT